MLCVFAFRLCDYRAYHLVSHVGLLRVWTVRTDRDQHDCLWLVFSRFIQSSICNCYLLLLILSAYFCVLAIYVILYRVLLRLCVFAYFIFIFCTALSVCHYHHQSLSLCSITCMLKLNLIFCSFPDSEGEMHTHTQ